MGQVVGRTLVNNSGVISVHVCTEKNNMMKITTDKLDGRQR